jgi:hypothetical protein
MKTSAQCADLGADLYRKISTFCNRLFFAA